MLAVLLYVVGGVAFFGIGYAIGILLQARKAWLKDPYHGVHIIYWSKLRFLVRFVAKKDQRLEIAVRIAHKALQDGGMSITKPPALKVRTGFANGSGRILAEYCENLPLILVDDEVVSYPDPFLLQLIVCHEMGHHVDFSTKRVGHPLFEIIQSYDAESFADAVACYCLELISCIYVQRPFDWAQFAIKLPVFLARMHEWKVGRLKSGVTI